MIDRVVQYPHRYRAIPVAGQENVFDFVPVPGAVTAEGTPLNKATLLSDEAVEYLGADTISNALLNIPNFLHSVTITESGDWISPRNGLISLTLVGGGGGGGYAVGTRKTGGGGGAGEIKSVMVHVAKGDLLTVMVGSGGSGGGSGSGSGGGGGQTLASEGGGITTIEPFGLCVKGGNGGGSASYNDSGNGGASGNSNAGGAGGKGGSDSTGGVAGSKTFACLLIADTLYNSCDSTVAGYNAGGGGGGGYDGPGGAGGAGNGEASPSYGGGGGGAGVASGVPNCSGGSGGNGLVIIRY